MDAAVSRQITRAVDALEAIAQTLSKIAAALEARR